METQMNNSSVVDYEEGYHTKRHSDHQNEQYYGARAKIALTKFFKNIPKDAAVLDYGCGLGQNIYHMPNAIGFDISEYGLNFCREKGIKVTNDLSALKDNSFDYVFSAHVLEHHPNPKEMIENMRKKLRKGQDLILVIPYERHGKSDFNLDLNQHLYSWNFRTINNLLITSGFKIRKNKYIRGAGYKKLLFVKNISFAAYQKLTVLLSYIFGIKEMMIIATKE